MNHVFRLTNEYATYYYHQWKPSQLTVQIELMGKEFRNSMEALYVGSAQYRHQGEGDPFLKQKSFYIADNPWNLAKSLLIASIIASVGCLITYGSLTMVVPLGLALFFAASEIKEYWGGNHLEKALSKIVPSIDTLKAIDWKWNASRNIIFDATKMTDAVMKGQDSEGRTVFIVFKLPSENGTTPLKLYYFGKERFVRLREKSDSHSIDSNNILCGADIKYLLSCSTK